MNRMDPALPFLWTDPSGPGRRAGMRLHRCEIYNWGTFHGRVWSFDPQGDNALLTGDIGSGKSTLVDAITTLLVPAQKISYNKAAGAELRERDLRSYVLGHYKSERSESSLSARPIALRDHNSYSVILGRFRNEGFGQDVTLAQVFWFKDMQGQPSRFYVVADTALSIAEHFSGFGPDINSLRKRLRSAEQVEIHDSFPPYGAAFRRRFGIESEQALDLFHQTVSMKSVGNLTDFVRQHMLEAFPIEPRIAALIAHFDDLRRAHELVLKAKAQIAHLTPLVTDCDQHASLSAEVETLRRCREALRGFFAGLKAELLNKRLAAHDGELRKLADRIGALKDERKDRLRQRDDIRQAIADNGGDRLDALRKEIADRLDLKAERAKRADRYEASARSAGLAAASDADSFDANRPALASAIETAGVHDAELQNTLTEETVAFRQLKDQHSELSHEIRSLKTRRSNIPGRMLAIRETLCRSLGLREADLPFAGELIEVRSEEQGWEGAAERVLHSFALSLLVPEARYAEVAAWVDGTHLGDRLVYFRVRERRAVELDRRDPRSLVRKLAIRPDCDVYPWLDSELARRFNYICCDTLDEFRREERALTRSGQVKTSGERHEKDDRHRLDDRTRYVLGWSNEAKITALEARARGIEQRMAAHADRIAERSAERRALSERLGFLQQLSAFDSFRDLDWKTIALEIERLERERRELEEGSDVLRGLERQLAAVDAQLTETETALERVTRDHSQTEERRAQAYAQLAECGSQLAMLTQDEIDDLFPRLEVMREPALGEHRLTVESCDNRQQDMRQWLQGEIDAEDKKLTRLRDRIIGAMRAYIDAYPQETREVDAAIEAASEYRTLLRDLQSDGLPGFEARFKQLLNENTIREVANFQSQLARERHTIQERIDRINHSLHEIDYNPGRFIILEAVENADSEIRGFRQDLRSCTEGTLTGSDEDEYSEAKFLQIKQIIERFRGRSETAELDRRWRQKVTDVRNWFTFSASERWREDGSEHEHYADSGGKSGGQKEKLAYTVLAASLAYQFGLEWGEVRSRNFRCVLIDEAFGRGSDDSTRYALELFRKMSLQLLIVTPLQKIHIIEPHVAAVGFVHNQDGARSMLRNLTIEEYRAERALRAG